MDWIMHVLVVGWQYLKEQNPNIRIGMADPMGAAMYNYYANGVLESSGNSVRLLPFNSKLNLFNFMVY